MRAVARRLAWFAAIWAVSVVAVGGFALIVHAALAAAAKLAS